MAIKPIRYPRGQMTPPDIFHAATGNDVVELSDALRLGQRLDTPDINMLGMTPMHIACIFSSNAFIAIAIHDESFDPWVRDFNLRLAFDHAAAKNNVPAMKMLYHKMYPNDPSIL